MTRYPFEPLADICRGRWLPPNDGGLQDVRDVRMVAEALGRPRATVYHWKRNGLTLDAADQAAIELGLHVAVIWPESIRPLQQMHPDCGSRATAVRHRRHGEIPNGRKLIDVCQVCAHAMWEYDRRRHHDRMSDPEYVKRERQRNRDRMRRKRAVNRNRRDTAS